MLGSLIVKRTNALLILTPFFLYCLPSFAYCLIEKEVRKIDAGYEQALVNTSIEFIEQNLHANFIWVHNHARVVQQSRDSLIRPMREAKLSGRPSSSKKRVQSDVSVLIVGNTAIVYGFTDVERSSPYIERTGSPRNIRYHFMRTYTKEDGRCLMLANHTMEVWREGQADR